MKKGFFVFGFLFVAVMFSSPASASAHHDYLDASYSYGGAYSYGTPYSSDTLDPRARIEAWKVWYKNSLRQRYDQISRQRDEWLALRRQRF